MKYGKDFFSRDAVEVARELLGKILVVNGKKVKIVETEAYYDENDPASRACKNGTLRKVMLAEAGTILVYGIHNSWLINFVTGKKGKAEAVLIRAVEPLNFNAKCSGPGLLTRALGIDKSFHEKSLFDANNKLWVEDDKIIKDFEIIAKNRIGVKKDLPIPLRFYIKDNEFISRK